ncbi:MAG: ATP-binding cassette domain-containing protein [Actinomycetales bacterium]|nr:ATP-binding cassette domain-containing protein [Actinomycetales bacterium]
MPAALDVRDLVVRYGTRTAVAGVDLTAAEGQVTALVGPNGAGKTSTVECCVGLRRPTGGRITVLGEQVGPGGPSPELRSRVGVMLQDGGLYGTARPLELVRHLASMYPDPRPPSDLLERLGIDPGTRTAIRRMSGGEQRRVAAAAALVGRPALAFLDEPTTGLDALARRDFHDLVRELVEAGTTIVLTTHIMDDVERLADHVVVVADGRVIRDGSVPDLIGDDESVGFRGPLHADVSSLRAVLPADGDVVEGPPGHYRVTGAADPLVLSAIAAWCAQHGIRTADLSVGRRSLEDVVIDLVGSME